MGPQFGTGTGIAKDIVPSAGLTAAESRMNVCLRTIGALLLSGVCASELTAQRADSRKAASRPAGGLQFQDPYTGGQPAALERLRYVRFGPFAIGTYHGTKEVDALVGGSGMTWIETEHFKIGAQLPPLDLRGMQRAARHKLEKEVDALRPKLTGVPGELTELDPWLRSHVLAARCEQVYRDFQELVGFTDRDFPMRPRGIRVDDSFMGLGPYLGQSQKYTVLIFERASDQRRYASEYMGIDIEWPQRHSLGHDQSILFATALDYEGNLFDDTALHVHLTYNLVYSFCDGFRSFLFETPVWFKCGLAQSLARRIDDRFPQYDRPPTRRADARPDGKWAPRALGLVKNGAAKPFAEMQALRDFGDFKFHDYVLAWSRAEFLLQRSKVGVARYLFRLKAPLSVQIGTNDWAAIVAQEARALEEGFGFATPEEFDAAWATWVKGR
jgi:hypothetical protein